MTPSSVKATIKDKFRPLLSGGYIKTECKGDILTVSGSIICVSAVHQHVLQGLIPNHCKQILRKEEADKKKAIYTYRFYPDGLPAFLPGQKAGLKSWA